ncbi:KRAB-A domain-containing protein 2-like [Maniola jurtina]|uniref:KRAB-A domain-containing protein 2-like n=1 Tax=Maniola jurtina TaxID=191418 RepID=UPI001E68A989|nr:KRAB-A domain-containing protein 2-like [Maniola jurtina]
MADLHENEAFNYEESKIKYFEEILQKRSKIKYFPYDEESKKEFILFVKSKKKPYYMKFDTIKSSNNDELLILKRRIPGDPITEVLPVTKCFDVMAEIHLLERHALSSEMAAKLKLIYHISPIVISIFVRTCNVCQSKYHWNVKISNYTPQFSVLCKIIRLYSDPDNRFSHIIIYVDTVSNYVLIRPTYSEDVYVVAYELLKIFLDFGLPENLIVGDKDAFYTTIMEILESTDVFPSLPSVIRKKNIYRLDWASQTTTLLITSWMRTRNSRNWAIGLKEIQWHLNNLVDFKILNSRKLTDGTNSPFNAHFGFIPNHNVIKTTEEPRMVVPVQPIKPKTKPINTFESSCLKCGKKIYEIYYRSCVICKRKCHFDCCVINVVEPSPGVRNLEATCDPCEERKNKLERNPKLLTLLLNP